MVDTMVDYTDTVMDLDMVDTMVDYPDTVMDLDMVDTTDILTLTTADKQR